MAFRKKPLRQVLPALEQRTEQIHARVAQSDLDRLERIEQLSGRGKSWAIRRGLELVEAELLALAKRAERPKGRTRP